MAITAAAQTFAVVLSSSWNIPPLRFLPQPSICLSSIRNPPVWCSFKSSRELSPLAILKGSSTGWSIRAGDRETRWAPNGRLEHIGACWRKGETTGGGERVKVRLALSEQWIMNVYRNDGVSLPRSCEPGNPRRRVVSRRKTKRRLHATQTAVTSARGGCAREEGCSTSKTPHPRRARAFGAIMRKRQWKHMSAETVDGRGGCT